MLQTKSRFLVSYLLAGILIFLVQTHRLCQSGFLDYDSAKNWQIVQEIGSGNFEHLFQHASPTFFLFYAVFTPFLPDFHAFIALNCIINVLAILLIGRFVAQVFKLTAFQTFVLLLFTGFSGYLTANGRYFTIEAPSLLLFALLLPLYYQRFTEHSSRTFLQVVGLLALGLTLNYKLLLLFPVAILLEFVYQDKAIKKKHLLYAAAILLVPFIIYGVVAWLVGLPFYRLPAVYYILIHNYQVPNPGARIGFFHLDFTFYLHYFLRFESPLLFMGILFFPVIYWRQIFGQVRRAPVNCYGFIFFIVYPLLTGMHLLQKAPRGLFLIYSLLYAIAFICGLKLIKNRALVVGLVCISIVYQIQIVQKEFYRYAPTNYPRVISELKANKINKVATTVGLGIMPFAQKANIAVTPVFNEEELKFLEKHGYQYVLLDDYYLAANILKFKNLEKLVPLAAWSEPSLMAPYLYLDQSEFAGFSYQQALEVQCQAVQDSVQLRLLRIP
ncbi:hypothetical protein HUW51_23605 [Adhaeribacter swui]|uniref:Glycosyltransferase family 39 protein n=1 Tax=Adhaeribacter swui TaxID=2086471 RepID=A0A7G7GEG3_9BACT|nr:hypothetical protein [Adhaeribacter swui]QNF35547.1 hypothetical protein HUW51_23605 [Adhaeribacter swui]